MLLEDVDRLVAELSVLSVDAELDSDVALWLLTEVDVLTELAVLTEVEILVADVTELSVDTVDDELAVDRVELLDML